MSTHTPRMTGREKLLEQPKQNRIRSFRSGKMTVWVSRCSRCGNVHEGSTCHLCELEIAKYKQVEDDLVRELRSQRRPQFVPMTVREFIEETNDRVSKYTAEDDTDPQSWWIRRDLVLSTDGELAWRFQGNYPAADTARIFNAGHCAVVLRDVERRKAESGAKHEH